MDEDPSHLPSWLPPAALPPESAPTPAPLREPVWSGLEVVVLVAFTLFFIVTLGTVAYLVWAIATHGLGVRASTSPEAQLVIFTLISQTGGLAAGFFLAWLWIARVHGARFWQAIHWRQLPGGTVGALMLGGAALMVGVQILGHILPMPSEVPMDRMFTPQTAWLLVIYGVGIAPFFEEFFFRGLLYPSLLATFREGMGADELRSWRPLLRLIAALGLVAILFAYLRLTVMGIPWSRGAALGAGALALALALLLVLPGILLDAAAWAIRGLVAWQRPEWLAIAITGLLFGMLHAAQLGWAWAAVLILVLVGVVLTMVRASTGSVMASWLFHCAYNGTLFAAQYVGTQGFHHFT